MQKLSNALFTAISYVFRNTASILTLTRNTVEQTPGAATLLHLVGADTASPRITFDGHAATGSVAPNMVFRRSRGTAASPSAVQSGDRIATLSAFVYGATGYSSTARATVAFNSAENCTDSAQGTYISLATTKAGGTSLSEGFRLSDDGSIAVPVTITAVGTNGNQTINKSSGRVNIAAGGTSVTVTNSLVTANSTVIAVCSSNDATAYVKNVVPAAGSFTINLGAAATGAVAISFMVINGF